MNGFKRTVFIVGFLSAVWIAEAFAASSVVIRLMAVNPSKTDTQQAVVKSYLPKEAKPDDIIKKGDLQVIFDAQQGSYYVYGEFELKPSEVMEFEVELRDIWTIADAEIESLRAETVKYSKMTKDTEFADRIAFLCKTVTEKLAKIQADQKASPSNPEQKISIYRENLAVLESVKSDLATVRGLLSQSKPFSSGAVWGMILAIVIFLAILGVSFYFVWYRQIRTAPPPEESFHVPSESQAPKEGSARRNTDQKKDEVKDVDQILGERP